VWKIGESSPSSSVASLAQEARPGNSKEPTSQAGQLSKRLKPQDMKKLFEWMAEPLNLFKVRMAGKEVGEIHQDIAMFVNKHCLRPIHQFKVQSCDRAFKVHRK
jgi:hypothetical protein